MFKKISFLFVGMFLACNSSAPGEHKAPSNSSSDGGVADENPYPDMVSPINTPVWKTPTTNPPHCGDVGQPLCKLGEACNKHADCSSDVCSYQHVCLPESEKSCSAHFGGDTCGIGETGTPDVKHGSCCESAPLFGELSNVQLDRWLITAGRMRTFIERVNGDVRTYARTLADWKPEYDEFVPSNMAEADEQLGSYFQKKSCQPGYYTGHTYWTPPTPTDYSDFTKDQLDSKALNCVTWHTILAFCKWDGKRMATTAEIQNAFTEGGKYVQPFMWRPGAVQYVQPDAYSLDTPPTTIFNHSFGYSYPETNVRADQNLDVAYHISPPGRFPMSWNEHGHEIIGNLLVWNATAPFWFSSTFSWEHHGSDGVPDSDWRAFEATAGEPHLPAGYYAIGGICSRN